MFVFNRNARTKLAKCVFDNIRVVVANEMKLSLSLFRGEISISLQLHSSMLSVAFWNNKNETMHETMFKKYIKQMQTNPFHFGQWIKFVLCCRLQVVQEYERAVIFRLGRLMQGGAKGPGIQYRLFYHRYRLNHAYHFASKYH